MLLLFWLPRVPMYRIAASWCRTNLWGARWICGIRHRVVGAENISVDAAHRDVEAQLDVGDARAHAVLSAARLRRQEGAPVDPVLRLGLRARVADHHRPQGGHRCDAADRGAGPRAVSRRASGSSSIRKARASAPARGPSTRPAARGSRIELATPILPVAHNAGYLWPKGLFGKRPGTVTISFGQPISPARQGRADADRGSRDLDRGRSRAARRSRRDATR